MERNHTTLDAFNAADHGHTSPSVDADYRFGQPKVYLAPHELARLTLLRSQLGETRAERAAERLPNTPFVI